MLEGWCDTSTVAHKLGISESAVLRLVARGSIASVMLSGRRLYRMEAIDKYVADPERVKRSRAMRHITEYTDE